MTRHALATVSAALAILCAAPAVRAGAWSAEPGWTYSELSASTLSARRVSGGIDTLETTNSSLRLYSELALYRRLAAVVNVALVDHHTFGDASSTRLGDLGLGLRYTLAEGRHWAVAPSFSVQIPTVLDERRLGAPHLNAGGVTTFANDATGVGELIPGLLASWHLGPFWGDVSGGYALRLGYVDQFSGAAQIWWSVYRGLSLSGGVHTRTNLQDVSQAAGVLANGVGESAEYRGWYGRIDYRLSNGLGLGLGYDSSLHLVSYPASPAVLVRLSFAGKLW